MGGGKKMNPDLARERGGASFRPLEMAVALFGADRLRMVARVRDLIVSDKRLRLEDLWHLPKKDRYIRACERSEVLVGIMRANNFNDDEMVAAEMFSGEDFFLLLHLTMFVPGLENLASAEQMAEWGPLARNFYIIGTYAQTELGHGSNVAGLETCAELDTDTDCWVINTPTLTSTKWWPGGLAKSCTHCILMARMKIRGKDYGPHAFLLQVRDLQTHKSIPGVTLLDIGAKMGYNGMDNGGMQLRNVRIPRTNLLMRYTKVSQSGEYSKVGNEKLLYAAMTFTRKQIVLGCGYHLAKSCIIALRYSAVRRQFPSLKVKVKSKDDFLEQSKASESQILDYSTQQYTLFPLLATSFGMQFTGFWLDDTYNEFRRQTDRGDLSMLSEIHSVTSSLKATMTKIVADGIEACRKACGGHGFLQSSGIPIHLTSFLPQATYEGDFVVLSIQTGRALLKVVQNRMKGDPNTGGAVSLGASLDYISKFDPFSEHTPMDPDTVDWRSGEVQIDAFERRSCGLVFLAGQQFVAAMGNGLNTMEALDSIKVELTRCTKAHAHVLILRCFQARVAECRKKNSPVGVQKTLERMCSLYALYWMEAEFADFVVARVLGPDSQVPLLAAVKDLLKELRPDIIALADSWMMPDHMLNSVLGRYDGDVYQALFDSTKAEPLNESDVSEGYYRHLQYILHPERKDKSHPRSRL